jgi:hypothetical protein
MIRKLEDSKQAMRDQLRDQARRRAAVLADTLRELREVEADLRRWVEDADFGQRMITCMGLRLGTVELANRAVEREGLE